jgi:hypothetical protein
MADMDAIFRDLVHQGVTTNRCLTSLGKDRYGARFRLNERKMSMP